MRRRIVFALILLNCLLGIALFAHSAGSQIIPRGIRNCCSEEGGDPYCCNLCCWFVQDCESSAQPARRLEIDWKMRTDLDG